MTPSSIVYRGATDRLDRYLAGVLAPLSRTQIQRLIKEGRVTVNGRAVPARHPLAPGEKIEIRLPDFSALPPAAADSLPILYEDGDLIAVNKPVGLVVHPAGPHREDTVVQRLWPRLVSAWGKNLKPGDTRPGVVHRLDRGTSGILLIAKHPQAAEALSRQFADRSVRKVYWAVVEGQPTADRGHVASPVGRSRSAPHRMSTEVPGRWSETEFEVMRRFPPPPDRGAAFLEVRPKTGRTHQIRVQLAALGHPILGDKTYGATGGADRPLLHARELTFHHPRTGKPLHLQAPAPGDFAPYL